MIAPKLMSALGCAAFIFIAWLLSNARRRFPWRAVLGGLLLQVLFALFILRSSAGKAIFSSLQKAVDKLGDFSGQGAAMVFGPLASSEPLTKVFGPQNALIFGVYISATIIFISALSSFLYHYGILQKIVQAMAYVMQRLMKTTGSESLAAAANIFVGQTEAALLIKPYISGMTKSEIMALMTAGMATIASGVMIVYANMGVAAGHLLTASVLSAPASLLIAKVMFPEQEIPQDYKAKSLLKIDTVNGIDALCRGAAEGTALALNVLGMLIAFVAFVALVNYLFSSVQGWVGISHPVTLQNILGVLNAPFAWLMGVPLKDCNAIGQILGERIVLNEFIGYIDLLAKKDTLSERSVVLATYALCGFANFASIAIQIGGIGALAPERRGDLARLGVKSMIGGLLASYLTATIAGMLL